MNFKNQIFRIFVTLNVQFKCKSMNASPPPPPLPYSLAIGLLMIFTSLQLPACCYSMISDSPDWPSACVLYGWTYKYCFGQQDQQLVSQSTCDGTTVHVDYSFHYNSYVMVCESKNSPITKELQVLISPINHARKAKLFPIVIKNVDMLNINGFAMDWARGLLYYAHDSSIFVTDLKQAHGEALLIHQSNHLVSGLVVRPENSTIVWIENQKSEGFCSLFQARQDGQNVSPIYEKLRASYDYLYFDYITGYYMARVVRYNFLRVFVDVFRMDDYAGKISVDIGYQDYHVKQMTLHNGTILFTGFYYNDKNEFVDGGLFYSNLTGPSQLFKTFEIKATGLTVMEDNVRPFLTDSCETILCKQPLDYCIPHNDTYYSCQSNPKRLFRISDSFFNARWAANLLFLVIIFAVMLSVVLIVLLIAFISKKKVKFYQIRLKSLNRVNSAKLEPKPEATEEVAE